jgi:hypothetical protein
MEEIVQALKDTFYDILNNSWLDESARKLSIEKVKGLIVGLGGAYNVQCPSYVKEAGAGFNIPNA